MTMRNFVMVAAGLLTGLGVTVLGQACYPGCEDVEPLRFSGGDFARDSSWGEFLPHPERQDVRANLDLKTNTLTVVYDSPEGMVEETWTLGGIDIW
jgi:hypothetical protein